MSHIDHDDSSRSPDDRPRAHMSPPSTPPPALPATHVRSPRSPTARIRDDIPELVSVHHSRHGKPPPPPPLKVSSRHYDKPASARETEHTSERRQSFNHASRDDSLPSITTIKRSPSGSPPKNLKRQLSMDDDDCELPPLRLNGTEPQPAFISCDTCGVRVPLREQLTDQYTARHWHAHRALCNLSPPPAKRRRAKRTEEERIHYLRTDPYVQAFEPYKVHCKSCDKWIRLRPNSTYCSIPWDAHRKSCLAKRIASKNSFALNQHDKLLENDPYARKFDAERVLCAFCDKWIAAPITDNRNLWEAHKVQCRKAAPPTVVEDSVISTTPLARPITTAERPHSNSPPPYDRRDSVSGSGPTMSRRRNAEQREAQLRSDPLIQIVEESRVFCSLCQKWVQLRQDSSFCAYPWTQHRGKCLARSDRQTERRRDMESGQRLSSGPESEEDADGSVDEDVQESRRPFNRETSHPAALDPNARPTRRRLSDSYLDLDAQPHRITHLAYSVRYLLQTMFRNGASIHAIVGFLNASMPEDRWEEFDTREVIAGVSVLVREGIKVDGDRPWRLELAGDVVRRC
ncbi:hypothetical protein CYLTODRAFT_440027 [Cylindrobasidium torrendii FP15055 ss-10]|uniref:Uncharacterized protein n=1 Tax=Cylindrobasidium torrendii FP15055 ss-10 TaxID=1314674 RepID=A0A0D7BS38_9AGAR|nr:hypothetical protein CYLTODRAFT_440027 [Cylindrobasidium torrendii FP15055 ss-10]